AGPAGGSVEVTVHRPGLPQALTVRVVRTHKPVPEQGALKPLPPAPSPHKAIDDALDLWSRGDRSALDQVSSTLSHERPEVGAESFLYLVKGLLELEGDEAQ